MKKLPAVLLLAFCATLATRADTPEPEPAMKKILPNTRLLCDGMKGQNYWFNGCMEYLMECLGEDIKVYDYWFFTNITGDSLMHVYSKDIHVTAWCPANNLPVETFARRAFDACGYEFEFATNITDANRVEFLPRIRASIDKGIPVICRDGPKNEFGIICGYDGDELYYLLCNNATPQLFKPKFATLIFAGAKKEKPSLRDVYKKAVMDIPSFLTRPATEKFSFGKQALIDWAESFQNGTFDNIPVEKINAWNVHGTHLCQLGTNACAKDLLWRAKTWNPEMEEMIDELLPLYDKIHNEFFQALAYANGGMNGGFNIQPETIKDKNRMKSVSGKIMDCAMLCDEILAVFERHRDKN